MSVNPEPIAGPVVWDQRRYLLKLAWSPRIGLDSGGWVLDVSDAQGVAIASSVPVVISDDLLRLYRDDERAPLGSVQVVRLEGEATDPKSAELGAQIEIRYVS